MVREAQGKRSTAYLAVALGLLGILVWRSISVLGAPVSQDQVKPPPQSDVETRNTSARGEPGPSPVGTADVAGNPSETGIARTDLAPSELVHNVSFRVVRHADRSPIRSGVRVIVMSGPHAAVLDARVPGGDGLYQADIPGELLGPDAMVHIVWDQRAYVRTGDTAHIELTGQQAMTSVRLDALLAGEDGSVPLVELDTGCVVRVRVVDMVGVPIAGVQVWPAAGGPEVTTDSAGLAVVQDVPRGNTAIACRGKGLQDASVVVEVGADADVAELTVRMLRADALR